MKKTISVGLILLVLLSCNKQEVDTKAEAEKLMQTSREWSKLASGNDVDKITSYWTEDAIMYENGRPTLRGRNEIRKMIEGMSQIPGFKISWEPKDAVVAKSGDIGYLLEESTINMPDSTGNPLTMRFNLVTIWQKQADGTWKNNVQIMSPLAR